MIQASAHPPLPSSVDVAEPIRLIAPEEGESWWIMNNHQQHKLGAADTGGALSLWFETFGPGEGPPPHIHHHEDEIFVVLEGEVTFHAAGRDYLATRGTVVLARRGNAHTFRNSGTESARMLIMVTPAGFERFFAEAAYRGGDACRRPAPTDADVQRLLEAAPRHGLTFVAP